MFCFSDSYFPSALYEPADGKFMLGAWLDTSAASVSEPSGGDSPVAFNSRLNQNASIFHMAQNIPIDVDQFGEEQTANLTFVQATNTGTNMN